MTKVSKMSTYRSFNHQNFIVYRYSTDSIFLLVSHHRMIMCHVHRKKLATTSIRILHLYLPVERYRIDKKSLPFAISIFLSSKSCEEHALYTLYLEVSRFFLCFHS